MPVLTHASLFRSRLMLAAPLTALLLAGNASADEVHLHDGRVLVGKVTKKGDDTLEIATYDGVVVVAADQVAETFSDDDLRQRLAGLARGTNDSPFANLQLAVHARSFG